MGLTQEINSLLFPTGALDKSCTLQWISAHVAIEGNEMADSFADEARTLETRFIYYGHSCQRSHKTKAPLKPNTYSLLDLIYSREIRITTTRLKTTHFKDKKVQPDGFRSYVDCRHLT
ncbi:RNase H domain-containing protein [Trichonephila clavipes]|nr:RNase H domain-containing protein [Trichonephila clavipes]